MAAEIRNRFCRLLLSATAPESRRRKVKGPGSDCQGLLLFTMSHAAASRKPDLVDVLFQERNRVALAVVIADRWFIATKDRLCDFVIVQGSMAQPILGAVPKRIDHFGRISDADAAQKFAQLL
jgi:hypothetical protein